jgi:hypothetical protein
VIEDDFESKVSYLEELLSFTKVLGPTTTKLDIYRNNIMVISTKKRYPHRENNRKKRVTDNRPKTTPDPMQTYS